jgi:chromosome segregation ATPase
MISRVIDDLHERREQLHAQLKALQAQQESIARELALSDAEQQEARAAGRDVAALEQRRRHREVGLRETVWAISEIRARLAQADEQIRRHAPQQALDRDLRLLAAELADYERCRARLDGAYQIAIGKVADIAADLHELVWRVRERHDQLAARAQALRATAQQLGRPDIDVPVPQSWSQPLEQVMRGNSAVWRAYLTSVHNRAAEPFARELGAAAAACLVTRRRAAR